MKKMTVIVAALALAFAAGSLQAQQRSNPDANTLWIEDGKEIALGTIPNFKSWCLYKNKELEIKSIADGKGFSLFGKDGVSRDTATQLRLSPEYPYLVFRVTGVKVLAGYSSWAATIPGMNFLAGQAVAPQKGIFVFDLYRDLPSEAAAKKTAYLHFYLTNLGLDLEYVKLVKKPDYAVRVECADPEIKPGSKVKFTAELTKEAEDVSLTLTMSGNPRPIRINGMQKIQLKPVDKTQKIWSAEVEIRSIDLKKARKRYGAFLKMDVLGGELDEPVWVGLPCPVAP